MGEAAVFPRQYPAKVELPTSSTVCKNGNIENLKSISSLPGWNSGSEEPFRKF